MSMTEEQILALFDGKNTVKEIRYLTGLNGKMLHALAKKHGLNLYGLTRRHEMQKKSYEMRQAGHKWPAIAEAVGYCNGAAAQTAAITYMKREGIER